MNDADRDEALLRYIAESIARIDQYTEGVRERFLAEPVVQDAVIRRLETLADAAGRLTPALKARHPEIPWRDVSGFRNVAAHGYLSLDLSRVWRTVEMQLPVLRIAVTEELNRSGRG